MRNLRKKNAYGIEPGRRLVDARRTRAHLQLLKRQGYTLGQLSKTFGIARNTLMFIANGRVMKVRLETQERVLGLDVTTMIHKSNGRVDAAPYREYIRRLGANGWGGNAIAKLCGFESYDDMYVFRNTCSYISPITAAKLDKAFRTIGDRAGTSDQSRRYWRERGWLPPAAYDEFGIPDYRAVDGLSLEAILIIKEKAKAIKDELGDDKYWAYVQSNELVV
jgi:hypothetical protein